MSYASSKAILLANYRNSDQMCARYHDILLSTNWLSLMAAIVPDFYWDYKAGLITDLVLDDAITDGAVLDLEANGIYHNDTTTILTNPVIPVFITGTSILQVDFDGGNIQNVYLCKGTLTTTLGDDSKMILSQAAATIFNLTAIDRSCPCVTMEDTAVSNLDINNDAVITVVANQDSVCIIDLDNNAFGNLYAYDNSDITYSLAGAASITANENDQGLIHL